MGDRFKNSVMVPCVCGAEALEVSYLEDDDQFELAGWHYGRRPLSWRDRLRYCWRIIVRGEPYPDWMVLDRDEANRAAFALLRGRGKTLGLTETTQTSSNITTGWFRAS